jgi:FkbM family methyltransferase
VLPIDLAVAGRRRNAIFGVLDPLFRATVIGDVILTPSGPLRLEASHPPERMLSYLFYNVLRYYEKSELGRYIEATAKAGTTFIDVGANLGVYSLIARKHGYDAVAIEPEPAHGAFLKRNEETFGKVLELAFSDAAGALPLYYERKNPGATSLFPAPSYIQGEGVVPVQTFSAAASQGALGDPTKIRLVKIDVEGFEAKVVAGMSDFLHSGIKPDIWCEVRGDRSDRNGGSYREVRRILSAFGYVARELRDGRDVQVPEEVLANRGVFDLLFTPKSIA